MRVGIWIFVLIFSTALDTIAQESDFNRANRHYDEGEFSDAARVYDSLYHAGYDNLQVAYNAANAYYRLGNLGKARLFYERALERSPDDEDVRFNLDIVEQLTIDDIRPLPKPLFVTWYRGLSDLFSWTTWMIASTVLMWFAWGYRFAARLKGISGVNLIFAFALSISVLLLTVALENYYYREGRAEAVVMDDTVYVKNEPNSESTDLFLLHEATIVEIRDQLGDWVKIILADGKVGWVKSTAIEKV